MEHRFSQILATIILFFGCGCVAAADHWSWHNLANVGNTVVGVGAGILVGGQGVLRDPANPLRLTGPDPNA